MQALFEDPMVQAGVAPFAVALVVVALLARLRPAGLAGLAVPAALLTTLALTTGIGFTPLSASKKVLLLVLAAPLLGLALDLLPRLPRAAAWLLALLAGAATAWIFQTLLAQAEGAALLPFAGVALFAAALVAAVLRLRDDGTATASATLGLGVAVGVSALLSASIGTLMNGIAVAMGGAALLAWSFLRGRALPGGWTTALTAALAAAYFASATFVLADLRWPVLLALLAVPLVAGLPLAAGVPERWLIAIRGLAAVAAALLPIGAAWLATGAATAA